MTDGFFKVDLGTVAYVIEGEDATNRLTAVYKVPGHLTNQSGLCSELLGCYGVVSVVCAICEEHHITQGVIKLGCHYIEALLQMVDLEYFG